MKILFDANTPAPLARFWRGHDVVRADELGWQGLENGALLDAAAAWLYEAVAKHEGGSGTTGNWRLLGFR